MSSAAVSRRYTPEEYLELERKAEFKNQYYRGEIYAMSGASRPHNLIGVNLSSEIHARLKGRHCEVYANDMRVRTGPKGLFSYPDIVAVCGEPEFLDGHFDTLLNPTLLVEILSPSTEAFDRGGKFEQYRRIDSLREYVLVSQHRALVERFARQGDEWVLSEIEGMDGILRLDSIGCEVPLGQTYRGVNFPGEYGAE